MSEMPDKFWDDWSFLTEGQAEVIWAELGAPLALYREALERIESSKLASDAFSSDWVISIRAIAREALRKGGEQ